MDKSDVKVELKQLETAFKRFQEALKRDAVKDDLAIDATIQRFEFTYELCWKTMKRFLALEGVIVATPKDVFKEAFRLGWLNEGDAYWSQMIKDRNLTSHTYDQKIALEVYSRIKNYESGYGRLLKFLEGK